MHRQLTGQAITDAFVTSIPKNKPQNRAKPSKIRVFLDIPDPVKSCIISSDFPQDLSGKGSHASVWFLAQNVDNHFIRVQNAKVIYANMEA